MATILLIVIYTAFVGLGIPDSLFGAAWPAIYPELELPVSFANVVTVLIFAFTMAASLMSARIINKFGTPKTVFASTAFTAVGLLGFALSGNFLFMCVCTLPLGFGAGAIDAALNNYVALYYTASHMNFLHCAYGVGVSVSPYLMSLALSGGSWRAGYRTAFYLQLVITIVTFVTLPVWKKVNNIEHSVESGIGSRTLTIWEMLKMPKVRMACFVFFASCGLEYTCGYWGSTYLVLSKGMSEEMGAAIITFYYLGITAGRFLSGVLAAKLSSRKIILLGQGAVFVAIVLMFLPLPVYFSAFALFLIGLGNGPLYPNLVHLTPYNFSRDVTHSVMGFQMASASVGIMVVPTIFGFAAQVFGTWLFAPFLALVFVPMVVQTVRLNRAVKGQNAK